MANNELLVAWLNDAHALEKGIVEALESQVDVAADHPEVQAGIKRHLEATKGHMESVKTCLEELGESPSTVKSGLATVTGKAQSMTMGAAKDNLVKSALNDYSTEHMEIASYKALIQAAEQLGQPSIVTACQSILKDEEAMAAWLDQQLPSLVREAVAKGEN